MSSITLAHSCLVSKHDYWYSTNLHNQMPGKRRYPFAARGNAPKRFAPNQKKRRSFRKYKGKGKFARLVKSVVHRIAEKKVLTPNPIDNSLSRSQPLLRRVFSNINSGTASDQRVGDKVTITSTIISIRLTTTYPNDVPICVDFYYMLYKPGNDSKTETDQLNEFLEADIAGNRSTLSFRNTDEYKSYRVLRRKRMYVRATITAAVNYAEALIKWKGRYTVDIRDGVIRQNAPLVLMVCSHNLEANPADPVMNANCQMRLYYTDL